MENSVWTQSFHSPFGELLLGDYQGQLCLCDWRYRKMRNTIDRRIQTQLKATYKEDNTPAISLAIKQLDEYFTGTRNQFDLPVLLVGTDFQKTVWEHLLRIPYGQTVSYLALSQRLGNIQAIRAVARANGANALSIIVPCHRVVGHDGKLVGYAGGIAVKKKLLEMEGNPSGKQLSLF